MYLNGKTTQLKPIAFIFAVFINSMSWASEIIITGPDQGAPKYYNENGKAKGFIVDITRWALEDMGQQYQIKLLPWNRAYANALKGKMVVIGLSKNASRIKIFDYSNAIYFGDLMIVVKKGHEFEYESVADLQGKVIGARHGASYGDVFDNAVSQKTFTIQPYVNASTSLKLLLNGRIDAVLIGPGKLGIQRHIDSDSRLNFSQFSVLKTPFKRDAKYLGIHKSKKMQPFIQRFNQSLDKAQKSGVVKDILERY